jgi:hypothetical protein
MKLHPSLPFLLACVVLCASARASGEPAPAPASGAGETEPLPDAGPPASLADLAPEGFVLASQEPDAAAAAKPPEGGWTFTLLPYFWAAGMRGDIGVHNSAPAHIDFPFDDIADDLLFGFMGAIDARDNDSGWGVAIDAVYMNVKQDIGPNLNSSVKVGMGAYEGDVTWRPDPTTAFEFLAGARYWNISGDLDIAGLASTSDTKSWVDPVVGARGTYDFDEHWGASLRGDIGGFGVGSQFTWEALGSLNYSFNRTWMLELGYRYFSVDYDDSGFLFDMDISGPFFGLAITF